MSENKQIHDVINKEYKLGFETLIQSDTFAKGLNEDVIRAISAKKDELIIIPFNMRDGIILGKGKGNVDWNCSAPHGAGRLMSRADAKQSFTVSEFKKQMAEVYTTSVSKATLDECPMAYKGMQDILDNIGPTEDVVKVIRPIYNFKAGDEE